MVFAIFNFLSRESTTLHTELNSKTGYSPDNIEKQHLSVAPYCFL